VSFEGFCKFLMNEIPNSAVPAAGRTAESPTLAACHGHDVGECPNHFLEMTIV